MCLVTRVTFEGNLDKHIRGNGPGPGPGTVMCGCDLQAKILMSPMLIKSVVSTWYADGAKLTKMSEKCAWLLGLLLRETKELVHFYRTENPMY